MLHLGFSYTTDYLEQLQLDELHFDWGKLNSKYKIEN